MNIEHLKKQAKNLQRLYPVLTSDGGQTLALTRAQEAVAKMHGYPSWHSVVEKAKERDLFTVAMTAGSALSWKKELKSDDVLCAQRVVQTIGVYAGEEGNEDMYMSSLLQLLSALFHAYRTLEKEHSIADALDDMLFPYRLEDMVDELRSRFDTAEEQHPLVSALSSFMHDGKIDAARYNSFGFRSKPVRLLRALYGEESQVIEALGALAHQAYAHVRWKYEDREGNQRSYPLHAWIVNIAPSLSDGHNVLVIQGSESAFTKNVEMDSHPLLKDDLRVKAVEDATLQLAQGRVKPTICSVVVAVNEQRDAKRHCATWGLMFSRDAVGEFERRVRISGESFSPIAAGLHLGIGTDAVARFVLRRGAGLERSDGSNGNCGDVPKRSKVTAKLDDLCRNDDEMVYIEALDEWGENGVDPSHYWVNSISNDLKSLQLIRPGRKG